VAEGCEVGAYGGTWNDCDVLSTPSTEEKELERLAEYTKTPSGIRKLKKILGAARPTEHRQAM
jgi:hypothetical protein